MSVQVRVQADGNSPRAIRFFSAFNVLKVTGVSVLSNAANDERQRISACGWVRQPQAEIHGGQHPDSAGCTSAPKHDNAGRGETSEGIAGKQEPADGALSLSVGRDLPKCCSFGMLKMTRSNGARFSVMYAPHAVSDATSESHDFRRSSATQTAGMGIGFP